MKAIGIENAIARRWIRVLQSYILWKVNGESLHHYEAIHLDSKCKKLYLLINAITLHDDHAKVIGIAGTTADITAIKAAQTERNRFFHVSKDLLCNVGNDGFFKQINPAFTSVLGYPISELYRN